MKIKYTIICFSGLFNTKKYAKHVNYGMNIINKYKL